MSSVVFSAHALSITEKVRLSRSIGGSIEYLSLFELKQTKSMSTILKDIANFRRHDIYVFLDFENSDLLKGFLFALPVFAFKWSFKAIEKSGNIRRRFIISSAWQLLLMLKTSFENYLMMGLFQVVRRIYPADNSNRVADYGVFKSCLYLKSNFWFGIQAGGSIGHIAGVANALSHYFKVTYLAPDEPLLLKDSVNVKRVNSSARFSLPYELNNLGFNMPFLLKGKIFREADFIYQRLSLYNFSGALMAKILRKPLILEYNGSEVWIQKNWSAGLKYPELASSIEKFNLSHANRIITVSEVLRDQLVAEGYDSKKIIYYPNCIDPEKYSPDILSQADKNSLRSELGFSSTSFVFTFVGTFGPWHGVEFLVEGINSFLDHYDDPKVYFLLIGDGVLRKKCESLVSPKHHAKVKFTGLVPQDITPKYLAVSDCYLSPHVKRPGEKFFGSPTKIFEYMAMGKPIIASSLEQIGSLFEHPININIGLSNSKPDGVLFEPNNLGAFVKAMSLILKMSLQERQAMGENARVLALTKYTWNIHVKRILS